MSSAALRSQNNIKAGIFVTVAIIIGIFVVFVLGDFARYFGPSHVSYTATYEVAEGVGPLGAGSFVKVGGIVVGEVDDVSFDMQEGRPLTEIDVRFSIPASMQIRSDARVSVGAGLISNDAWLEFSSLGVDGSVIPPGGRLVGSSLSMIDSLIGGDASANIDSTLESLAIITTQLEQDGELLRWIMGDGPSGDIELATAGLREAIEKANDFLGQLDRDWADWSGEVDLLVAELEDFARSVDAITSWINNNESKFQDMADNLDDTFERASGIARDIQEQALPKIDRFIDNLLATVDDLMVTMSDLQRHAGPWFDDVDVSLANVTLASQQLTQLLAEVTASPWRLLYRPTDKQLRQELIYSASRNFVFGAADLKSAAESMQRFIEAAGGAVDADDPQLEIIRRNLIDSARRYERAQEQMMDLLRDDDADSQ